MKTGFCNNPRRDLIKEIEWIGKNRFDFVDLFLEEDRSTPEKINAGMVKEMLNKYNLGVIGHLAWYLPIGSPIQALRDASVHEAARHFPLLSELGAKYVTVHANWPGLLFSDKEGIGFQVETLQKILAEAGKFGLGLMYEPIDTERDSPKNISRILKCVPGLWLHLDIGHSNLHGRKPWVFIKRFRKKIRHIHMHDNDGSCDQHLPIGSGSINWGRTIKALKKRYDGTITLEIFSNRRKHVLSSRDKLIEMWKRA
jgi:sugar phosphate isomerase/epimerase